MEPQDKPPEGGDDAVRYRPGPARGVLALALVAGVVLVGPPAGVGLTGVLLTLGLAVARSTGPGGIPVLDLRARPTPASDPWRPLWWTLAGALACVPSLLAAAWVVIPAVGLAVALAAVAACGAPSQLVTSAPRGLARTVLSATHGGDLRGTLPALRGAALAAGLLAVFLPLLLSADAAFAELAGNMLPSGTVDLPAARIAAALLVLAAGGALLDAGALRRPRPTREPRLRLGRTEWAVPLAALTLLLAAFVATQLATLAGGNRHVLQTAGLTYAQYAHSGFVQMLAVAALTLAVVIAARRYATEGPLLRALLAALCVLTLAVIASALHRLQLYENAYGYTRLRLSADAILLWLAALFAFILVAGRLPYRAAVAITGAAMLLFAVSNPDRRIAAHDWRRDPRYVSSLSADAIPALPPGSYEACRVRGGGVVGLNLSRIRAHAACS